MVYSILAQAFARTGRSSIWINQVGGDINSAASAARLCRRSHSTSGFGPQLTSRDVRYLIAIRGKADIPDASRRFATRLRCNAARNPCNHPETEDTIRHNVESEKVNNGTIANFGRLFMRTAAKPNGRSAMTIKCDYCRGPLGVNVHRYWRMRYCSADCVTSYQRRLDEGTAGKIRCLEVRLGDSRFLATRQGGARQQAA
jgi:hypothetical protein